VNTADTAASPGRRDVGSTTFSANAILLGTTGHRADSEQLQRWTGTRSVRNGHGDSRTKTISTPTSFVKDGVFGAPGIRIPVEEIRTVDIKRTGMGKGVYGLGALIAIAGIVGFVRGLLTDGDSGELLIGAALWFAVGYALMEYAERALQKLLIGTVNGTTMMHGLTRDLKAMYTQLTASLAVRSTHAQ
jgi:hypothetical protein